MTRYFSRFALLTSFAFACLILLFLLGGCAERGIPPSVPTTGLSNAAAFPSPQVLQSSQPGRFVVFGIPAGYQAWSLTSGPNRSMWMPATNTSTNTTEIIKLAMSGTMQAFPAPANVQVAYIIEGPDGNLWYTGYPYPNNVGYAITRMTPVGSFTQFAISERPLAIAVGPNDTLWFTEYDGTGQGLDALVGSITLQGAVKEYSLGYNSVDVSAIVEGPDGNMWLTLASNSVSAIAKVTPSGSITIYPTAPGVGPQSIASYGGSLWFGATSDGVHTEVDKMSTAGDVTTYVVPGQTGTPTSLIVGPDSKLWFNAGANGAFAIGRMTKPGIFHEYPVPSTLGIIGAYAVGPDKNIWFHDPVGNPPGVGAFVRLRLSVSASTLSLLPSKSQTVTVSETNYRGRWRAKSSDPLIATVARGRSRGTFTVTGISSGSASVTISDSNANESIVSVTVL
jgi:streptogramin lyase